MQGLKYSYSIPLPQEVLRTLVKHGPHQKREYRVREAEAPRMCLRSRLLHVRFWGRSFGKLVKLLEYLKILNVFRADVDKWPT